MARDADGTPPDNFYFPPDGCTLSLRLLRVRWVTLNCTGC